MSYPVHHPILSIACPAAPGGVRHFYLPEPPEAGTLRYARLEGPLGHLTPPNAARGLVEPDYTDPAGFRLRVLAIFN
jgi:hypothetical protein